MRAHASDARAVGGEEVQRGLVEAVGVEVRALLLDHEDLLPKLQDGVELGPGQRAKPPNFPAHTTSYYVRHPIRMRLCY